ncbi:MAG: hypothetical protein P8020_20910 [Acidobacteriota bacterium]
MIGDLVESIARLKVRRVPEGGLSGNSALFYADGISITLGTT